MSKALSLRRVPLMNIRAHPIRSLVIAILALAQAACVFGGFVLVDAMRNELSLAERRLGADLVVYPTTCLNQVEKKRLLMLGTPVGCHQPRSALARMSSNEDIAAVSYQLYVSETLADGTTRWIVGFEPETDFVLSPWIAEGEGTSLPRGSVLVGSAVADGHAETMSIYGMQRPIGAHLLATGSELDNAVFVPMDTLADIVADASAAGQDVDASLDPATDYSAALVRASDSDAIESVTNWINLYVRKVSAVRSSEALVDAGAGIRSHRLVAIGVLGAIWLVLLGALAVAQLSLMNERRQELAVWRSIGAPSCGGCTRGHRARGPRPALCGGEERGRGPSCPRYVAASRRAVDRRRDLRGHRRHLVRARSGQSCGRGEQIGPDLGTTVKEE